MGEALRDSPVRRGLETGIRSETVEEGPGVRDYRYATLPDSVHSKLWKFPLLGTRFSTPSPAAEASMFGGAKDNLFLIGYGEAVRRGAVGPQSVDQGRFFQAAYLSARLGQPLGAVLVTPSNDIVLYGQPTAAVSSQFCVVLSGSGGC